MLDCSSHWQLENNKARLAFAQCSGELDLLNPARGIALSLGAERLAVLGIDLPSIDPSSAANELECYVRGNDLVATYHETPHRKRRGQIYWRLVPRGGAIAHDALELVASMQTSLLDSDPTVEVHSTLKAGEALQLTDPLAPRADPLPLDKTFRCTTQPACFVYRLRGEAISYIEMVHPLDFVESEISTLPNGALRSTTRLFLGRLEKGVILRSRLRALIAPREGDVSSAARCYRDFAASEPPLTV